MSHPEQRYFCEKVKSQIPVFFKDCDVLDVGSVDINGNNKYLFSGDFKYIGLDIVEGKNVDVVCDIVDYFPERLFDVVISTEMLEHDQNWQRSVQRMYDLLESGGLLLITCAGEGRPVHGTFEHNPQDSPATLSYYCNITVEMLKNQMENLSFIHCEFSQNSKSHDTYFWGIKK